jgi:hypothetical protein
LTKKDFALIIKFNFYSYKVRHLIFFKQRWNQQMGACEEKSEKETPQQVKKNTASKASFCCYEG